MVYFREFLYLDMDFLHSYSAQANKGSIEKLIEQVADSVGQKSGTPSLIDTILRGGFLGYDRFIGGERKHESSLTYPSTETTLNDSQYTLIEKALHDEMFEGFWKYIHNNQNLMIESDDESREPNIGLYIVARKEYKFIDFDRVDMFYSEDFRSIYSAHRSSIDTSYEKFDLVRKKMSFFKQVLPFGAFLYHNPYLVPLHEEYLREPKRHIGFKLDGEQTVVGRISKHVNGKAEATSKVDKVDKKDTINDQLNLIQNTAFDILHESGFIASPEVYIIDPVGIHY